MQQVGRAKRHFRKQDGTMQDASCAQVMFWKSKDMVFAGRPRTRRRSAGVLLGVLACLVVACVTQSQSQIAWAQDSWEFFQVSVVESEQDTSEVEVSAEGEAARNAAAGFAVQDFSRAQKGSNREVAGQSAGYTYYIGSNNQTVVALAFDDCVVVYLPSEALSFCNLSNQDDLAMLKQYFLALDAQAITGGVVLPNDVPWYFTSDTSCSTAEATYEFAQELSPGKFYVTIQGAQGVDLQDEMALSRVRPTHVDFLRITSTDEVAISQAPSGIESFGNFLASIDYSPLLVTMKTTGVAIVFIFTLGLAAAYFTLRIGRRAQDIFDTIFTIPMVLPPTVCGFLLLLGLGNNTPIGRWFIDVGFPLVFSWPATVIAAVVVAFPLMYRSARGAFENLDPNMLDAARTLGWSNARIFFRLIIPLSWPSIAAGTVLSFARALGEFGATLFLAGNYVGITRTVPIAIYFEWMSGNIDVALFWTGIILVFSFLVILFINVVGRRTTHYRDVSGEGE